MVSHSKSRTLVGEVGMVGDWLAPTLLQRDVLTWWLKALREWKWKLSGLLDSTHRLRTGTVLILQVLWPKQVAKPGRVQGGKNMLSPVMGGTTCISRDGRNFWQHLCRQFTILLTQLIKWVLLCVWNLYYKVGEESVTCSWLSTCNLNFV